MAQGSGEVGEGPVQTANADGVPSAPTSDEIRSQIEQTRAEMSDTIDAIQSRLSPKRVLADAKDSVTEATVGRVKRLTQRTNGSGGVCAEDAGQPAARRAAGDSRRGVARARVDKWETPAATPENTHDAPVQHVGAERAWSASDTISRERRNTETTPGCCRRRRCVLGDLASTDRQIKIRKGPSLVTRDAVSGSETQSLRLISRVPTENAIRDFSLAAEWGRRA